MVELSLSIQSDPVQVVNSLWFIVLWIRIHKKKQDLDLGKAKLTWKSKGDDITH